MGSNPTWDASGIMTENVDQGLPAASREFGVYLPNVAWEPLPTPGELVDYAVAAEELGLDSVWVEDRLLHRHIETLDPITTLTFVAARTSRVRLGTSVLLVNLRNPLSLAKSLSTLDYLSEGRAVVGASLGGRPAEYAAAGTSMRNRVGRFTETLEAMRGFWGQGSADRVSRIFQPTELVMEPKPVQQHIPLWIGGRADAVFRRVAALGDGWLASSTTTAEEFARGWGQVQRHAAELGRDPESLTPAKFCYIHVADATDEALAVLEGRLPRYYEGPYDAANLTLYGPPERCIEGAKRLLAAGVRTLIFAMVTRDRGQLERVATEVVPQLRV